MNLFWNVLAGVLSGVFAGMGMGGGTLLIPILTLLLGVDQRAAQGVNLLVFLPMAIVVIIVYAKKKMINFKGWWIVSLPACLVSFAGVFFAIKISGELLRIIFGAFIIAIGIAQVVVLIVQKCKKDKMYKK